MLAAQLGVSRLLLHADELDGFDRQGRKIIAKRLGNHFLRLVQVHAGVHQINGRLHGFRATNLLEDGGHGVGVDQGVFTGLHDFAGNQRFGKGAGARQRIDLIGQNLGSGGNQMRRWLRELGCGVRDGGYGIAGLHAASSWACCARLMLAGRPLSPCKNFCINATCPGTISVGACPTPSSSVQCALGPRSDMAWAVRPESRSDSAPLISKTCAVIWS